MTFKIPLTLNLTVPAGHTVMVSSHHGKFRGCVTLVNVQRNRAEKKDGDGGKVDDVEKDEFCCAYPYDLYTYNNTSHMTVRYWFSPFKLGCDRYDIAPGEAATTSGF
jgi:hypothetical protein